MHPGKVSFLDHNAFCNHYRATDADAEAYQIAGMTALAQSIIPATFFYMERRSFSQAR